MTLFEWKWEVTQWNISIKKCEKELLLNGLRAQIDEIQESNAEADIMNLEDLKKVVQYVIDRDDMEAAIQMLAKYVN